MVVSFQLANGSRFANERPDSADVTWAAASLGTVVNASVSSDGRQVRVTVSASSVAVGSLPVHSSLDFAVSVRGNVTQSAPLACDGRAELRFQCRLTPLQPVTLLAKVTQASAMTTTATAGLLLYPTLALANGVMAALAELPACVFSHVEQLDFSTNPSRQGFGKPCGHYYRGTVGFGLGAPTALFVLVTFLAWLLPKVVDGVDTADVHAFFRFPSTLVVPMSVLGPGMVSCAVALLANCDRSGGDIALAVAALLFSLGFAAACVLLGTTWLRCRTAARDLADLQLDRRWLLVRLLLLFTVWDLKWRDLLPADTVETRDRAPSPTTDVEPFTPREARFKHRYFLLLDDMHCPWWVGLDLTSALVAGAVLGIRRNDLATCEMQLIALAVLEGVLLLLAMKLWPCGSRCSNVFLVLSKVGSFATACLAAATKGQNPDADEALASFFSSTGLLATVFQLLTMVVVSWPAAVAKGRNWWVRHLKKRQAKKQANGGQQRDSQAATTSRQFVPDAGALQGLLLDLSDGSSSDTSSASGGLPPEEVEGDEAGDVELRVLLDTAAPSVPVRPAVEDAEASALLDGLMAPPPAASHPAAAAAAAASPPSAGEALLRYGHVDAASDLEMKLRQLDGHRQPPPLPVGRPVVEEDFEL